MCSELRQPIYLSMFMPGLMGAMPMNPMLEAHEKETRIRKARIEKLKLLFHHYGIRSADDSIWFKLAYALAMDFVPGMTVSTSPPGKVGRPARSSKNKNASLSCDIEEFALRRGITASRAATLLVKPRARYKGEKHRVLYERYRRFTKRSYGQDPEARLAYLRRRLA